jgi:hypothetical protein
MVVVFLPFPVSSDMVEINTMFNDGPILRDLTILRQLWRLYNATRDGLIVNNE